MKVYFIFDMKQEFINLYSGNERVLYNLLKQIYLLDKNEIKFAYNLFSQLTNPINKQELDRKIFIKHHKDVTYSKRNQIHYINNLYKDEISRLEIKNSYIRLEVEGKTSTFLEILKNYSKTYFFCDFKNQDYFFLNENIIEYVINKRKTCTNNINLVQ